MVVCFSYIWLVDLRAGWLRVVLGVFICFTIYRSRSVDFVPLLACLPHEDAIEAEMSFVLFCVCLRPFLVSFEWVIKMSGVFYACIHR